MYKDKTKQAEANRKAAQAARDRKKQGITQRPVIEQINSVHDALQSAKSVIPDTIIPLNVIPSGVIPVIPLPPKTNKTIDDLPVDVRAEVLAVNEYCKPDDLVLRVQRALHYQEVFPG